MDKKFNCPRCGYNTNHFVTYKRHITRKILCKNILSDDNLEGEYLKYNIEDKIKDFKMVSNEGKCKKTREYNEIYLENKKYLCEYCSESFDSKENLEIHLKKKCKMLVSFNNIYKFKGDTLGRNIYKNSDEAGDIYIIQTDYVNNDHYKIGITKHISKRLCQYRCANTYEPRLHYYFPCPNIKEIDQFLNSKLKKYNVKREIFKGNVEEIKNDINSLIKDHFKIKETKIFEPELKLGDLTNCAYCEKSFYTCKDLFNHCNICEVYKESLNKHPQNIPQKRLTENTECEYCKKKLSSYKNLRRHLKTCKEKQKDDTVRESMEELVMLLNEKLEKKDKQIEELVKKAGLVNMTNSHNNITNNIQNNIKLLNYKETDTSHLTENDYVRCLEHYNFCVPHIIRKIHFNPKKPENHNIYISNLKNSYVMIYMNNKWKVKNRDETISRLIDDKQILLEKKINEWVESGIQYPRIMAKFSRYLEKREENDVINAIKEDIKLMLYNNRNMIVENNKRIKLQKY